MLSVSKIRVVIAIRVSSKDQVEDGYGHDAQVRRLPEIVEEMGWILSRRPDGSPAIYDEGYASTTPQDGKETSLDHRPVMQALLAELAYTKPDVLLCRELDRLYRDNFEHALMIKRLTAGDVGEIAEAPTLTTVRMIRLDDAQSLMVAGISANVASYQKADLKIKLMVGRHERARQGKPNGGHAPYGYHRPRRKEPLAIHDGEAATYRLMASLVTEQKPAWGPAKIAHELVKRGIPNRSGKPEWTATTVRRILLSKAQCGYMRRRFTGSAHDEEWVLAAEQTPIISERDWDELQAVLKARTRTSGHNQRRHVLAGLMRCAACGKTLKANPDRRLDKDGKRYINYSCRVYNSGCTAGYSISERKALRELADWVNARLAATDAEGWEDDFSAATTDVGLLEERVSALAAQLTKATRHEERSYALFVEAEDIDEARAKQEYERRRDTVLSLTAELEQAQRAYGSAQTSTTDDAVSLDELREVLAGWEDFPDTEKRTALEVVVDRAVLGPASDTPRLTIIPAGGSALASGDSAAADAATADGAQASSPPT